MMRWHVGRPPGGPGPDEGVIALTASELAGGGPAVGFHEAVAGPLERAERVDVHMPAYRGFSLLPLLSWLACRLVDPGGAVTWHADRQQGPDSIRRLLEGLGWKLERERAGRVTRLSGRPVAEGERPAPAQFDAALGGREVRLFADHGVFSPERIDDGTALLLEVALCHRPIELVADVGTGYGPLAIGLVLGGVGRAAVATDVDCIALWLAAENARRCGVSLTLACTPDPTAIVPTALTVCNVPTHVNRDETDRLMAGLAARAGRGRLLAVVHASLEARYAGHLESRGLLVRRHAGAAHVVLEASALH